MSTTNLAEIARLADERVGENDGFLAFLEAGDFADLDAKVHEINHRVTGQIDCTACGNCCRTLIINVSPGDVERCCSILGANEVAFRDRYIETSLQGAEFVNALPCHFFEANKCTIYEARFTDCREFPHLHKDGFLRRLSGTMLHYGRCPIIFNVIEQLKVELEFPH